jgi:hypothetical protein
MRNKMPKGDGTGPIGRGARDGRGRRFGGRGHLSSQKGAEAMTGGRRGKGDNQNLLRYQSQRGFFSRVGNFFRQFNSRGTR